MMIVTPNPGLEIPQGLGSDIPLPTAAPLPGDSTSSASLNPFVNTCNAPSYCDGSILTNLLPACQPCTVAQNVASDAGPAMTPANVAAATAAATADEKSLCAQDPSGCAAYNAAINSPTCTGIFGTDTFGQFICGDGSGNPTGLELAMICAGGVLLLLLLKK